MVAKLNVDYGEYIGTVDAALLLGVKPSTVAAWRTYRQNLNFIKPGGKQRVLYRKADVLALKEAREQVINQQVEL